jgi:uncharacterized protein YkwD
MRILLLIAVYSVSLPALAQPAPESESANDTAKNVNYMTSGEKEVVRFLNEARTDPRGFANKYLKGNRLKAARECYRKMRAMRPLPLLRPFEALFLAAKDHAEDAGRNGRIGHIGSDGSNAKIRVERYGIWLDMLAENCLFGSRDPLEIVVQLLIDEGVRGRGHRKNILHKKARYVGVSIRPHTKYKFGCVMVFAGDIRPKTIPP